MTDTALYLGDCLEILKTLPDGCVDAVITDPPYNVGKDYGTYKDNLSPGEYSAVVADILDQSRRVSRGRLAFYVSGQLMPLYLNLMPGSHPVIIYKRAAGVAKSGWRMQYHALMCEGKPCDITRDLWDDIRLPGEGYFFREERFGHPGITSLALTKRIIQVMTTEGATVLDPFMGSGTTGVACKQTGRNFIGIEIDPAYFAIAEKRIAEAERVEA